LQPVFTYRALPIILLLAMCFFVPLAHAESVSWTTTISNGFLYGCFQNLSEALCHQGQYNQDIALYNPTVTIQYRAMVKNAETGEIIPPNGTVTTGTPLELVFDQHFFTDAYWFITGGAYDSPYGEWRADAAPPPTLACVDKDFAW
jgi:hypothetical protein